jgi:MFS family permease
VAQVVLARAGWRWVFFVGVLPALVTFWIQRGVPEPDIWRQARISPPSVAGKRALWSAAMPRLLVLLAMNTFGMFAWWGLFTWIPAYLALPIAEGGRGFTLFGFTSFLVVLNLCGMWPGYLLFGWLADTLGRKRAIVLYLACAAVSVAAFAVARSPGWILLTASVSAFFGTGFFTGAAVAGSELFPTPIRATALGLSYNTARGISAFAPFVIGAIGQAHGLGWGFAACGVAFAAAALAALWIPETRGTELS